MKYFTLFDLLSAKHLLFFVEIHNTFSFEIFSEQYDNLRKITLNKINKNKVNKINKIKINLKIIKS